jgi:hypothetical protein
MMMITWLYFLLPWNLHRVLEDASSENMALSKELSSAREESLLRSAQLRILALGGSLDQVSVPHVKCLFYTHSCRDFTIFLRCSSCLKRWSRLTCLSCATERQMPPSLAISPLSSAATSEELQSPGSQPLTPAGVRDGMENIEQLLVAAYSDLRLALQQQQHTGDLLDDVAALRESLEGAGGNGSTAPVCVYPSAAIGTMLSPFPWLGRTIVCLYVCLVVTPALLPMCQRYLTSRTSRHPCPFVQSVVTRCDKSIETAPTADEFTSSRADDGADTPSRVIKLTAENARLRDHCSKLRASWSVLATQHSQAEDGLIREVKGWKQRYVSSQQDIAQLQSALAAARSQCQELTAGHHRDQATLLTASTQLMDAQAQVVEAETRCSVLQRQLDLLREQCRALQEDSSAAHERSLELVAHLSTVHAHPNDAHPNGTRVESLPSTENGVSPWLNEVRDMIARTVSDAASSAASTAAAGSMTNSLQLTVLSDCMAQLRGVLTALVDEVHSPRQAALERRQQALDAEQEERRQQQQQQQQQQRQLQMQLQQLRDEAVGLRQAAADAQAAESVAAEQADARVLDLLTTLQHSNANVQALQSELEAVNEQAATALACHAKDMRSVQQEVHVRGLSQGVAQE